ncbi:hypothetical protein [Kosmotoga pacifica]|nr:hypothetical protein [Kosmotoga pacifica]
MDILEAAKEKLYEDGFFSYYSTRKKEIVKISYILRSAKPEKGRSFLKKELGALKLLEYEDEFVFLIEVLSEREKSLEERVKFVVELSESENSEVLKLLYYIYPFSYPPVPLNENFHSVQEYLLWKEECDAVVGNIFDNYIMLECALNFHVLPVPEDLSSFLLSIKLTDIKKLKEGRERIAFLNSTARKKLKNLRYSHPYVRSVLFAKNTIPIIIDGSNIAYSKAEFPDLKNLSRVFELLAYCSPVYFPYRIVFDGNVRYKIRGSQQLELERWLMLPHVELYSPADERIIQLAKSVGGSVLSYDRFMEYDTEGIEIIRPEDLR